MSKVLAWAFLILTCAAIAGLFGMRTLANNQSASEEMDSGPAVKSAAVLERPPVKNFKAGMVIDGATVLKTADLVVDWKKWLGQNVIVRGTAYGAGDNHVAFTSTNVVFKLTRMDSETRRWFMRECFGAFVNPECSGLTIMVVPEDGRFSRELANVQIMR